MNNRNSIIFSLLLGTLIMTEVLSAQNFWQNATIPGNDKAVNVLAVDANNNIFAGTNGNGLYRSTDGGTTWLRIDNTPPNSFPYVYALGVRGSTIWAGTYDGVAWRSTNDGTSWTSITLDATFGSIITSFAFSDSVNVIVGTSVAGVFVSSKNATSWSRVVPDTSNDGSTVNVFSMIYENKIAHLGTFGDGTY